jgi:hypothetical protein
MFTAAGRGNPNPGGHSLQTLLVGKLDGNVARFAPWQNAVERKLKDQRGYYNS